jgi:hypothetical protein
LCGALGFVLSFRGPIPSALGISLQVLRETKMNLNEVVKQYLAIAGGYGRPAALADFGLDHAQTKRVFAAFDEDYHISRYFHFSRVTGTAYAINGFDHTHVLIDAEIRDIL